MLHLLVRSLSGTAAHCQASQLARLIAFDRPADQTRICRLRRIIGAIVTDEHRVGSDELYKERARWHR
jgi:hypothetical protein